MKKAVALRRKGVRPPFAARIKIGGQPIQRGPRRQAGIRNRVENIGDVQRKAARAGRRAGVAGIAGIGDRPGHQVVPDIRIIRFLSKDQRAVKALRRLSSKRLTHSVTPSQQIRHWRVGRIRDHQRIGIGIAVRARHIGIGDVDLQ